MFRLLGKIVSRGWPFVFAFWLAAALVLHFTAPDIATVTIDGPGYSLPLGYDSRGASDLLTEGFGPESSSLVILFESDKVITPLGETDNEIRDAMRYFDPSREGNELVGEILSPYKQPYLRPKLTSRDGKIIVCGVGLKSQFINMNTKNYIDRVLKYLDTEVVAKHPGLSYEITGSGPVGRDYSIAAGESLDRTRVATVLLVVTILLLLYRSPLAPIVPLATILLSLFVSTCVMALVGRMGYNIPNDVPVYLMVILFGSGTDYCLFLIGRYREELAQGHSRFDAVRISVTHVGEAITASAGTTIAGLCMMWFADFPIFRTTGPALGIGLAVGLLASLTFAPALMVVFGKTLFWPMKARIIDPRVTYSGHLWARFADIVIRRPGLVLMLALIFFVPLGIYGGSRERSYDLFGELPEDAASVRGNRLMLDETRFDKTQRSEQLVLVVKSEKENFRSREGLELVEALCGTVMGDSDVIQVRCITRPLGNKDEDIDKYITSKANPLAAARALVTLRTAYPTYVSADGHITRLNILIEPGAFTREAVETDRRLIPVVGETLKKLGMADAEYHFGGITSHMSDLGLITRSDIFRLQWTVLLVLYIILAVMLRGGIAPIYLLATMVINYFAALGIAHVVFVKFGGVTLLDWKVEFFLFVLLVAIGVDYNIYIMSRLREERKRNDFRRALRNAIITTGSIISSCGIIMAGTFASMMRGTVAIMVQLGFAMAVGVLMDTFIVRPLVVPALALLLEKLKERLRRKSPS